MHRLRVRTTACGFLAGIVCHNGRHLGQLLLRLMGGAAPTTLHRLEPVRLIARASDLDVIQ